MLGSRGLICCCQMWSEELRVDAEEKVVEHEEAAHDKRNWVRLTYDCNDRCIFCLDSDTHDGEIRSPDEIKEQILDGRRKGATRLILSGGEPTIHPRYVDFVKLGRLAGYSKIQTVTNGRMFSYREFLTRCLDEGLSEITFSIHGPNARIHDALVGVRGAFDEEIRGLSNALEDGRPIVNIDVCVNRGNVKVLPELIEKFVGMGVREYDLLQVIPFGRAFAEGRDTLFYDLEEAAPYLREAFSWSEKPDMHIWLNRFPPAHCEGYEHLIQDPYKLNDEVRGRKEEYEALLARGEPLDCRDPARCRYCYLERLCDTLDEVRDTVQRDRFDVVRVDTEWERGMGPVFGGDPASARRARKEQADAIGGSGNGNGKGDGKENGNDGARGLPRRHLPLLASEPVEILPPTERARRAAAKIVQVVAPDLDAALAAARAYDETTAIELELESYEGLGALLDADHRLEGRTVLRAVAATVAQAEELLAIPASFEVAVLLTRATEPWLLSLDPFPVDRLALRQPSYERLTEAGNEDVDLAAFFARFTHDVPVENVAQCILGRAPRPRRPTLDTSMLRSDGRIEIFRYTKRYILDRYYAKSLRCKGCAKTDSCDGMHINWIRAHGFGGLEPIPAG